MRNDPRWIDNPPILISEDAAGAGWGWLYKQREATIESADNDAMSFVPIMAFPGSSIVGVRLICKNDESGYGVKVAVYKRKIQSGAISDTLIIGEFDFFNTGETGYFLKTVSPFTDVEIDTNYAYFMRLRSYTHANPTEIASVGLLYQLRMI